MSKSNTTAGSSSSPSPVPTSKTAVATSRERQGQPIATLVVADAIGSVRATELTQWCGASAGATRPLRDRTLLTVLGLDGFRDLRLDGVEVEARALLHRWVLDGRLGQLRHFLLHEHEPPELVHEPLVEEALCAVQGPVDRVAEALERVEAQVGDRRRVHVDLAAEPAVGLLDEAVLEVVDPYGAERALAEVVDFVAVGRALAGDHVQLVVTVEMVLVGHVADLLAFEQLLLDVRIAGGGDERGEPIEAGDDPVLDRARGHMAGPANHRRRAE